MHLSTNTGNNMRNTEDSIDGFHLNIVIDDIRSPVLLEWIRQRFLCSKSEKCLELQRFHDKHHFSRNSLVCFGMLV